jgi:hypothetical protein
MVISFCARIPFVSFSTSVLINASNENIAKFYGFLYLSQLLIFMYSPNGWEIDHQRRVSELLGEIISNFRYINQIRAFVYTTHCALCFVIYDFAISAS